MRKQMGKYTVIYNVLLYIAMAILLFCAFSNLFQLTDPIWYENWQNDSEWLVWQRIYDDIQFGFSHNCGLLGEFNAANIGSYDINHGVYTAQVGLQGLFYGIIFKIFPGIPWESGHYLTIVALVSCCLVFLVWIKKEFGLFASILSCFAIMLNQWLIVSAKNMYWVTFTFILPMILMLVVLQKEEKGKELSTKKMFFLSILIIFIRAACGYEFISLAMINLELPLFYFSYKNRWNRDKFIHRFVVIAEGAILGFLLAVGICIIQVYLYTNHDIHAAIDSIIGRIGYRTGGLGEATAYTGIIRESLIASKWSVLKMYFNEGKPLVGSLRMNQIMPIIAIGTCLIGISDKISPTMKEYRRKVSALGIMTWISLLGPLSWMILATAHAYIHTHICYILWSMPFLILGFTLAAITMSIVIFDILKYLGKLKIALYSFCIFGVIGFIFYNHYSYGSRVYSIVSNTGKKLYSNGVAELWFENNTLFYVIDKDMASENVFLHYYLNTDKEEAFINSDFKLEDKEICTLPWNKFRLAKIELPKDCALDKIVTGQFKENVRFWEIEIPFDFLNLDTFYDIYTLTDDNWTYGVNNFQNCFLIASNDLALYQLKGKFISMSGLMECQVVDVVKQGDYFWIYVDKDIKENVDISVLDQITVQ